VLQAAGVREFSASLGRGFLDWNELDPLAVRQLLSSLGQLLARSERLPRVDLPDLHLVLTEKA